MNRRLVGELQAAVATMYGGRLKKLVKPGPLPFLMRAWQKWRDVPAYHRVPLFFGPQMTVILPEIVSETIYTYGFFDELVTYVFLACIEPGQTVLDIGAHFGYFSLLASELVGPPGSVHAFEPTLSSYQVAQQNLRSRANVHLINAGAGEEECTLEMLDFGVRYSAFNSFSADLRDRSLPDRARPESVTVPVIPVDPYIRDRQLQPSFIKVDAENFELHVIRGLRRTVEVFRPKVLLETGSESSLQAIEILVKMGYQAYVCTALGRLEPFAGLPAEANARFKDVLLSCDGVIAD